MDSKKTKFVLTAESVFVMQITQVSVFIVQYYWEKKGMLLSRGCSFYRGGRCRDNAES